MSPIGTFGHAGISAIRLLLGGKRTSPCGWFDICDLGPVHDQEESCPIHAIKSSSVAGSSAQRCQASARWSRVVLACQV